MHYGIYPHNHTVFDIYVFIYMLHYLSFIKKGKGGIKRLSNVCKVTQEVLRQDSTQASLTVNLFVCFHYTTLPFRLERSK